MPPTTLAENTIARLNAAPVNGKKIGCTEVVLDGFPLRLDFRCARGTYVEAGDRITAALGGVAATAPLYWPGYVEATLDAPLVVNAPELGVALTTFVVRRHRQRHGRDRRPEGRRRIVRQPQGAKTPAPCRAFR